MTRLKKAYYYEKITFWITLTPYAEVYYYSFIDRIFTEQKLTNTTFFDI